MAEGNPVERLRAALHALHERTEVPLGLRQEVLNSIVLRDHLDDSKRRRRRQRRVGLIVAVGLVAAGSTTAAFLLNRQPATPQFGIACRAAAEIDADAIAFEVAPEDDPIKACARLWQSGQLPDSDAPPLTGGIIPPLTACIGPGGAIEVFPNLEDCEALGLDPAAPLSPETQRVVALTTAVSELNLRGCLTEQEIKRRVEELFAVFDVKNWEVRPLRSSGPAGACVKAQVEPTASEVVLFIL